ncbi:MAG: POTRA domain-containing protein, partial [Polyangiaceae bacterium]
RHGYPSATISLTTRVTDDPVRVSVLLDVHPGEPRNLERRVFYVYDADPQDLASTNSGYRAVRGDRADESALDSADSGLETKLRSKGYRDANVSHDVVLSDGAIVLRVRVDAGKLFLPRFTGNDHFDADALTAALAIDTDTDFTPQHLADKIRDFYRKHGYLDVEVSTAERGGPKDRVHYEVFSIIEHRRVGVAARGYPCLKEAEIKNLTEGGPSSAAKIGVEINSYLEEELPGADLVVGPNPWVIDTVIGGSSASSRRAVPIELDPDSTYVADTYERAVDHVQELYRNEGYLHAQVGPVQILRRHCSRYSRPGKCDPVPFPPLPAQVCSYDATNLPLPVPPLDAALTCTPDPLRGVECATSMDLRIPVKLGPRTTLYDVTFTGVKSLNERVLAKAADVKLGAPANTLKLEEARRRVLDVYKEEGYAYADIRFFLDESLDHTRARARFEVVEGEQVIVESIVIQGNDHTREGVIRRRIALEVHKPYRASDVKKTQERIATLNVFTSVNVSLADPYVPQKNKSVIISVSEPLPEHVEVRPGFSTGEGFRITNEYGNQNILGTAIAFSTRLQLSYLPDAFIVDRDVAANYRALEQKKGLISRIAGRLTIRTEFPEIGLGPLFRFSMDALYLRSLQRDFTITKFAGIPTLNFRPVREVQFSLSQTAEYNQVTIFSQQTVEEYLLSSAANADIQRFLRVPDGDSEAFAQRLLFTWDRRDNSFNAHSGTNFVSGVEHVDWYLTNPITNVSTFEPGTASPSEGHFVRFTQTFAGYIPLGKKIVLAAEMRTGLNVQTTPNSTTYPDRLFFMGGFDSMRGWTLDSFIPQDYVDKIRADAGKADTDPSKFTASKIAVRGGNLMI